MNKTPPLPGGGPPVPRPRHGWEGVPQLRAAACGDWKQKALGGAGRGGAGGPLPGDVPARDPA